MEAHATHRTHHNRLEMHEGSVEKRSRPAHLAAATMMNAFTDRSQDSGRDVFQNMPPSVPRRWLCGRPLSAPDSAEAPFGSGRGRRKNFRPGIAPAGRNGHTSRAQPCQRRPSRRLIKDRPAGWCTYVPRTGVPRSERPGLPSWLSRQTGAHRESLPHVLGRVTGCGTQWPRRTHLLGPGASFRTG